MGLVLSILVSFIGVFELLSFYTHLRRVLTAETEDVSDLDIIRKNHLDILAKRYRNPSNYSLRTSQKAVVIGKPHEDLPITNLDEVPNDENRTEEDRKNGSQGVKHKDFYSKPSTSKETYTIRESAKKKILKHYKSELFEKVDDPRVRNSEEVGKILKEEISIDRIHGRRSSSPFPTYERMKPRGSICGELVENPTINVTEVDEEESDSSKFLPTKPAVQRRSRSKSPSPHRRRTVGESKHRSTEYYSTKLTVRPKKYRSVSPEPRSEETQRYLKRRRRSKSFSNMAEFQSSAQISDLAYQLVDKDYWSRSPSPFKEVLEESEDNKFRLVFDEQFKDSLDGVKQKEESKKNFRKRHGKKEERHNRMLCYTEDHAVTPSSSTENFAGAILSSQEVVCGKSEERKQEEKPSTSKEVKKAEAFWVK